jgi:hypothetical protein
LELQVCCKFQCPRIYCSYPASKHNAMLDERSGRVVTQCCGYLSPPPSMQPHRPPLSNNIKPKSSQSVHCTHPFASNCPASIFPIASTLKVNWILGKIPLSPKGGGELDTDFDNLDSSNYHLLRVRNDKQAQRKYLNIRPKDISNKTPKTPTYQPTRDLP